ncbi:MAG: hypothetical protein ABJC26_18280 [Gemmatimonadaceae bacterium]
MSDAKPPLQNPTACPTNHRIFLQRSIVASIAASVLGASSQDSGAAAKPSAAAGSVGATGCDHSDGTEATNDAAH